MKFKSVKEFLKEVNFGLKRKKKVEFHRYKDAKTLPYVILVNPKEGIQVLNKEIYAYNGTKETMLITFKEMEGY